MHNNLFLGIKINLYPSNIVVNISIQNGSLKISSVVSGVV